MGHWWKGCGIVVTGVTAKNTRIITVICPELVPLATGPVTDTIETITVALPKGTDSIPQAPSTINLTQCIECTYLGLPSIKSVPDVVQGEQVLVYRYEGDDVFYWMPFREDTYLRMQEHIRIGCWNKTHRRDTDEQDQYYLEIDTKHNRGIRIRTSLGRNETYQYNWEIQPDAGRFILEDNDGNIITVISKDQRIVLENKSGTKVELEKTALALTASAITLTADQITLNGDVTVEGAAQFESTIDAAGYATFSGGHGPH